MKSFLMKMITSAQGLVSSKIIIGSIGFIVIMIASLVLAFVNPSFPGLSDIIITLIITASGLLGLTTFENLSKHKKNDDGENI